MRITWAEITFFGLAFGALLVAANNKRVWSRQELHFVALVDSLRRENARLTKDVHYLHNWSRAARPPSSLVLGGITLEQDTFQLRLHDLRNPIVLYTMDPHCQACIRTLPFVEQLARQRVCGTKVVGVLVSNEHDARVAEWEDLDFPVLTRVSGPAWDLLPLRSSAVTIVLGRGGVLEGWWDGELSDQARNAIASAINRACARGTAGT
jgi:hypothetical protein